MWKYHSPQNGLSHRVAPAWQRTQTLTRVGVGVGSSRCEVPLGRVSRPVGFNAGV